MAGVCLPSPPQERVIAVLTRPQTAAGALAPRPGCTRDLVQAFFAPTGEELESQPAYKSGVKARHRFGISEDGRTVWD